MLYFWSFRRRRPEKTSRTANHDDDADGGEGHAAAQCAVLWTIQHRRAHYWIGSVCSLFLLTVGETGVRSPWKDGVVPDENELESARNLMGTGFVGSVFIQEDMCMGSHEKIAANLPICTDSLSRKIHQ